MIRACGGICIVLLMAMSCDRRPVPEVNFSLLDSLMTHNQLDQADSVIQEGLSRAQDSLTLKKLAHRLRLVDIQKFYRPLYRSLQKGDTAAIRLRVREKTESVKTRDSSGVRWYLFDSWVVRAKLDSLAGRMTGWKEKQSRAMEYPTAYPYRKIDITLNLAVYAMEGKQYVEARAHLDNALRRFPQTDLTAELTPVYLLYMNGHFDRAYRQLTQIPEEELKGRWRKVKIFLQKYRKKLTLEDRFKLW